MFHHFVLSTSIHVLDYLIAKLDSWRERLFKTYRDSYGERREGGNGAYSN